MNFVERLSRYVRYKIERYVRRPIYHPIRMWRRARLTKKARKYFSGPEFATVNAAEAANMAMPDKDERFTGCSWIDYYTLHSYVMKARPQRVLELGSGISSLYLAHALKQVGGKLWTIEEDQAWYDKFVAIIPEELSAYINHLRVDKVEDTISGHWGVRYEKIPVFEFDMIFIDGPDIRMNGRRGIDLDFLLYDRTHPRCRFVAMDGRIETAKAYKQIIGSRMHFDYVRDMGFIRAH